MDGCANRPRLKVRIECRLKDEQDFSNLRSPRDMELNIPPKYLSDIENAAVLLKNEGCQSIYLFGSIVTGKIHDNSDIDIGIKGLPKGKFFEVCAKVYFALDNNVDIVDFDNDEDFYSLLNRLGEIVKIG
ncbi:MAG: nucleotidyltransferase domain-containing protein [Spirochaetia bacterium]|nr:nucleotidyltransferase domain-containing protein [Spirochaetia bacterium]